jgi:hypothetical protein
MSQQPAHPSMAAAARTCEPCDIEGSRARRNHAIRTCPRRVLRLVCSHILKVFGCSPLGSDFVPVRLRLVVFFHNHSLRHCDMRTLDARLRLRAVVQTHSFRDFIAQASPDRQGFEAVLPSLRRANRDHGRPLSANRSSPRFVAIASGFSSRTGLGAPLARRPTGGSLPRRPLAAVP